MRWMLLGLLTAGCSATMVSAPGGAAAPAAYGPVNEQSRGGLVCFLANGARFVVQARREDAYKKMFNACGGSYRIDGEGPQASGGALIPVGNTVQFVQRTYWYIQFSCVPRTVATTR